MREEYISRTIPTEYVAHIFGRREKEGEIVELVTIDSLTSKLSNKEARKYVDEEFEFKFVEHEIKSSSVYRMSLADFMEHAKKVGN